MYVDDIIIKKMIVMWGMTSSKSVFGEGIWNQSTKKVEILS